MIFLTEIEFFLITFLALCVGFLAGSLLNALRVSRRFNRAVSGEVLLWGGKAYTLSPVPNRPPFPGFARQKGSPTGMLDATVRGQEVRGPTDE